MSENGPQGVFDYFHLSPAAKQAGWHDILTMGSNPWYGDFLKNKMGCDAQTTKDAIAKARLPDLFGV